MPAAKRVLIVGGGVAGMSSATMLARAGVEVRVAEADPQGRVAGAGITITSPTLRAFQTLGILDQAMEQGHTHDGLQVCTVAGAPVEHVRSPILGPGIPGAGGILRPVLHRILADAARAAGARIDLGTTVKSLHQDPAQVTAEFADGSHAGFDALIGADGIYSGIRKLIMPEAAGPQFTGQACWRLTADRLPQIDQRHFFLGGPGKCGMTPVSKGEMYLFYLEHVPGNPWREPAEQPAMLRRLLEPYGGPLAVVRDAIGPGSRIVYRPLEGHLVRSDWFRGRVLLIGDAAHASTPQLASGAGMAAEDGIVLADELARASAVHEAFAAFMRRRFERCRLVVENSLEIGRLEMEKAPPQQQTAIVAKSLAALARPI